MFGLSDLYMMMSLNLINLESLAIIYVLLLAMLKRQN